MNKIKYSDSKSEKIIVLRIWRIENRNNNIIVKIKCVSGKVLAGEIVEFSPKKVRVAKFNAYLKFPTCTNFPN